MIEILLGYYSRIKLLIKCHSDFIVIGLLLIMAIIYYTPFITKPPLNTHLWRQTDCLSITENYYKGAPFLSPELHILLGNDYTTGKSAGEFPVIYYVVSLIWKLFGPSYFSYRFIIALISFTGLLAFYKTARLVLQDQFWSAFVVLLFFTSPVLVAYGASFLTDVPAFSFALIGMYAFARYRILGIKNMFWWSMSFFALAGLLKVSSLIVFVFLGGIYLLELFSIKTFKGEKIFQKPRKEWLGFAMVILLNFVWYAYAEHYNNQSNFKYTFNSIYPIWSNNAPELNTLWADLLLYIKPVFFSPIVLTLMLFMGVFTLLIPKRIPFFVYLANLVILVGAVSYFLLWAPLMGIHDYYYIAMLILFPSTFLPFIYYLKSNYPAISTAISIRIFAVIVLLISFTYCYQVLQLKTGKRHGEFLVINNKAFVNIMLYYNWDRDENIGRFESIRPYLNGLGITPDDKVISLPDNSFSVSLYFMGQKGWTNRENYTSSDQISRLVDKGAKYLLLSDLNLQQEEFLQPFINHKIGDYKGIGIYKLQ